MTKSSFRVEGVANSLWNEDAAPLDREDRTWSAGKVGLLWAATAVSLPTYLFASGMVALGISVGAVLGSVLVGSLLVAALAIGCGHAGVRYGVPFAVLARVAFGVTGAKVPVALRLVVGCAWVGIGCWLGAEAILAMLKLFAPLLSPVAIWVCFGACLLAVATPLRWDWKLAVGVLLAACCLLVFVVSVWLGLRTPGVAVLAADLSALPPGRWPQGQGMVLGLTAVLGLWLPVVLGACDIARRIRSQSAQMLSAGAVPVAMLVFCGVSSTMAALAVGRGLLYWSPVSLAGGISRGILAFVCLALLAAAVLLTARPLCGWLGEQVAGLMPSRISGAAGRGLACLAALLSMPWQWVASPQRYLGGWLTGCAGLLAPLAAIMLVEYFVLRRRWLNVDDLYQRDGLYEYSGGWNWKAFGAVAGGWMVMGFSVAAPSLAGWREEAVWIGTGVSAALYWVLRSGPSDEAQIPPTPLLIPLEFEGEAASG